MQANLQSCTPDTKSPLELILCEGCGVMHTLKELLETGRPKLEIVQTH
jgi:hypothetical protein